MKACPKHNEYPEWMFTCPKCLMDAREAKALGAKPEAIAIPASAASALPLVEETKPSPPARKPEPSRVPAFVSPPEETKLRPERKSRPQSARPRKRRPEMTQLVIPLRRAELQELKGAASKRGLRPATWARMRLLEEVRSE